VVPLFSEVRVEDHEFSKSTTIINSKMACPKGPGTSLISRLIVRSCSSVSVSSTCFQSLARTAPARDHLFDWRKRSFVDFSDSHTALNAFQSSLLDAFTQAHSFGVTVLFGSCHPQRKFQSVTIAVGRMVAIDRNRGGLLCCQHENSLQMNLGRTGIRKL
jgi:hypothetical protein